MIDVIVANITALEVDVIVNAANESLLGGAGVDGAIHQAAGSELLEYCRDLGGCATGSATVSPGYRLSARWVVHAVGPVWHGGTRDEPALLRGCYKTAFRLAGEKRAQSIAFPCISIGAYGYPAREAAAIAVDEMRRHDTCVERIVACCFNAGDAAIYNEIVAANAADGNAESV